MGHSVVNEVPSRRWCGQGGPTGMDRETPMESCVGHEVVNGVCLSGVLSGTRHSHHQGGPNRVLSRTWNGQYGPNGVLSVSWHGQKDLSGVLCRTCHSQWAPSGRAATTYGKKKSPNSS